MHDDCEEEEKRIREEERFIHPILREAKAFIPSISTVVMMVVIISLSSVWDWDQSSSHGT